MAKKQEKKEEKRESCREKNEAAVDESGGNTMQEVTKAMADLVLQLKTQETRPMMPRTGRGPAKFKYGGEDGHWKSYCQQLTTDIQSRKVQILGPHFAWPDGKMIIVLEVKTSCDLVAQGRKEVKATTSCGMVG